MTSTASDIILENCAHGIIAVDVQARVLMINVRARSIIKHADPIESGIPVTDIIPVTGKLIRQCIKHQEPFFGHGVKGRAENLIVSINVIRSETPDHKVTGAVCSFVDMDEFKKVAHKLDFIDMMDRRFQTVFDASFDGIWLADGQGRVIDINRSSEKIMGIPRSEIIGKKISDIVKQGLYSNYLTDEVIRTRKKISQMQTAMLTGKQILCTGIPVLDRNGEVAMVVINERDMSHLITAQQELEEVRQEKERYREELTAQAMEELRENAMVAESAAMQQITRMAVKLGRMNVSDILILGESGTGKGLLAKFIHSCSDRAEDAFIQINCSAIPESILEAELFGYERGAFTGAKENGKPGLFELAHEGTLFLDEIGELAPAGQAKLLKYLDDHEVMRLGGTRMRKVNCTVIAATNRNLAQQVREKKFREDLYYRLNSICLTMPPLRSRPEDIFELVQQFLATYNTRFNMGRKINPLTIAMMQTYRFPGNIRELKNIIKKGVVMSEDTYIDKVVLSCMGKEMVEEMTLPADGSRESMKLDDITAAFEKEVIKSALNTYHSTRDLAAYLNVSQPTIVRKLKKYGLSTTNSDVS